MVNTPAEAPVKRDHLITRELKNEFIIIDTENGQIHSLNKTAAMIWQMSDGKLSIDNMAQHVLEKFDASFDKAKSDVEKILRDFHKKGLIKYPVKKAES